MNYLHVTYAYLCHPPGTMYSLHYQITIHQLKLNDASEMSMAYVLASLPLPLHSKHLSPTRPRAVSCTKCVWYRGHRDHVSCIPKTEELFQEHFYRLRAPGVEEEEDCGYHPMCRLL